MAKSIFKEAGVKWSFVYLHTHACVHMVSFLLRMPPCHSSPPVKFLLKYQNLMKKSLLGNIPGSYRQHRLPCCTYFYFSTNRILANIRPTLEKRI